MPVSGVSLAFLTWLVMSYLYFVLCKRSHLRTLGYRIGGVKIVDIRGDSPSFWSLTLRLLFAIVGAFVNNTFGLIDLFWITGDDDRQALRDQFAHTYVVKTNAQPAGRGAIVYDVYHVLTWTLLLPGVRRFARQAG